MSHAIELLSAKAIVLSFSVPLLNISSKISAKAGSVVSLPQKSRRKMQCRSLVIIPVALETTTPPNSPSRLTPHDFRPACSKTSQRSMNPSSDSGKESSAILCLNAAIQRHIEGMA
jgi:hypothetical protein